MENREGNYSFSVFEFFHIDNNSGFVIYEPVVIQKCNYLDTITVNPGEIVVTAENSLLSTLVDSGVSICLWDKINHVAGMNHFITPSIYDPKKTTAHYGNVSIIKLINMMNEWAPLGIFEAHIFGGAAIVSGNQMAKGNIAIADKILAFRNIPVVSRDVEGDKGRRIIFNSVTGKPEVYKIPFSNSV